MQSFFQFTKVLDVKNPNRGTAKSAGIDFFAPNFSDEFISQLKEKNDANNVHVYNDRIVVYAQKDVLIPSGIHYKIPENTMLMAANKSGVATKKKLTFGAQIGDEGYQGQFHIHLFNNSDNDVTIMFGEKVLQAIIVPVLYSEVVEVESVEKLYENHEIDTRKNGGFGSTGIF